MAWFYMQAMGNSTERIIVFDNIWNFDEDMLYDATVTLARTKSKEKKRYHTEFEKTGQITIQRSCSFVHLGE